MTIFRTTSKIYPHIHYSSLANSSPWPPCRTQGNNTPSRSRSSPSICSFSNQAPRTRVYICLRGFWKRRGPFCLWEMELAENLVETLVGIPWWLVKYLQRRSQFIWKQMCKCLAGFPVSGTKNVPLLRAAVLLTFKQELTPGEESRREHGNSSSAARHCVRWGRSDVAIL